ncbi:MAG: glycosyltransferase family 2 protein [Erysipelotrichaceae bacterium]|nr:glycosyltransferase family 2 protein [Erysipelotrichaceae bacterium]
MENKQELISIIMPAWNAAKTIEDSIQSALDQTWKNLEVLVIDDGSSDDTVGIVEKMAEKDSRVRLLKNPKNQGVCQTRYNGLQQARGNWIALLDSDDLWAPEKLEEQMKLQKKSHAELIFTGSAFIDAEGKPFEWILKVPETVTYRQLLKRNVISNSSVLIRKDLYKRYFSMDESLHEDYACWLAYLKDGHKAAAVQKPLLIYRFAANTRSGNKFKAVKMNWKNYQAEKLNPVYSAWNLGWVLLYGVYKQKKLTR